MILIRVGMVGFAAARSWRNRVFWSVRDRVTRASGSNPGVRKGIPPS